MASARHSRTSSSRSGPHLEIPSTSTALDDAGAHSLSSDDEYFSDASEGRVKTSRPATPVSPVPKTRVERVDDEPAYGEVPGTPAYEKRTQDAVPDEVEIVAEGRLSKRSSQVLEPVAVAATSTVVPRTVVEMLNPEDNEYGTVPGSAAYRRRRADSVPDAIVKAPAPPTLRTFDIPNEEAVGSRPKSPIPETVITPVDQPSTTGLPDLAGDSAAHPSKAISPHGDDQDNDNDRDGGQESFADDFDDFEDGEQAADDDHADEDDDFNDDFGDFDQPFNQPSAPQPTLPLIDFAALSTVPDLLAATQQHLDYLFPSTATTTTTTATAAAEAAAEPIDSASAVLPSERSRSLWKQLVTPPPLQPPNWTQSRIRRLFLVSLGVPVDLDQVLPPSKQKKLILPDISLAPSRKSDSDRTVGSISRLKQQAANDSSGSIDSNQSSAKGGRSRGRRSKGPPPPPDLDLSAVRRLCATTDEKLDGFSDAEIQAHVKELKLMTEKTSELLEYWLKRRDGLRKEKEAFEGVIENLVAHVRRVRR